MDATAVKQFFKLEIDDAILVLLTVTHPTIEPVRVVNNAPAEDGANDIVSNGETFIAFPFEVELPNDNEESPRAKLRIANVDREISESLMFLTSPPFVAFEIIAASLPDTILRRYARFELRNVTWDAVAVEGELVQATYASEPWPNIRVTPREFPGLF